MGFTISPSAPQSGGFAVDVPPQEPGGENFGLSLQFSWNGTPLGEPNVTTVNFATNLIAQRGISGDPNRIDVSAIGGGGGDSEGVPDVVADGTTDNLSAFVAALNSVGSFVLGAKPRAKFLTSGPIKVSSIFDSHPSISIPNDARGISVLVPGDNLPATTSAIVGAPTPPSGVGDGSGAEAAFMRVIRDTSNSASTLAYSPVYRGFNLDARGTTQTNPVHGVRIPNADNTKNPYDPDPNFSGNKDYVAGEWYNMDIIGWPGSGFVAESTNGRLHLHSVRALNNGTLNVSGKIHGFDLAGNDIVVSGHTAAGGNLGSGFKIGVASGFFAVTANVWGNAATRSLTCQAVWINGRTLFGWLVSEFNDWMRIDGGNGYWRQGVIGMNCFAPFNEIFDDDGIAFDFTPGGDPRLQAHIGVATSWTTNFVGNQYFRSTAVNKSAQPGGPFTSWMNVGGDLTGGFGTAHQKFIDISNGSMANTIDTTTSAPNARPWTTTQQATFTVTIASPGVVASTGHGLSVGDQVALTTTGALPTGLNTGITLFVSVVVDADHFQLARTPGGASINTSGSQSGTHKWGKLNTLPYDTHGGSQLNYLLMDSFKNETRMGSLGLAPSKLSLGMDPTDFGTHTGLSGAFTVSGNTLTSAGHGLRDGSPLTFDTPPTPLKTNQQYWAVNTTTNTFQVTDLPFGNAITLTSSTSGTFYSWKRTYRIEAGDRTQPSGVPWRHALNGMWELGNAAQYQATAYDARVGTNGQTRQIKAGQVYQLVSIAGGGIAGYTVQLPTDMPASYELVLNFTGGPITALTFTTSPTSSRINANSITVPASSPGTMSLRFLYRQDTNQWYLIQLTGGANGSVMGRVDGSAPDTGTVGEKQRIFTPSASAIAMTNGTPILVGSAGLTLPAGVWDIYATIGFIATSSPVITNLQWSVNTVNNAFPAVKDEAYGARQFASVTANSIFAVESVFKEVNLSTPTTYYPVAQADFTGGAVSGYSVIWARRSG